MRYAITDEPVISRTSLEHDALELTQDIAAAEAWYAELIENEKACDEICAVMENLHVVAETLRDNFYSREAIEALNISGDLTAITRHATEDITPQIAQEDIKDKIREGWEAFKKFINKVIDAVGNFFAKLFNMASAQAQKIVDSGGKDVDFAAEKETLTFDQYKNLKGACEALSEYVSKHIDVSGVISVKGTMTADSAGSDYTAKLNGDLTVVVNGSNNTLKVEDGKVTIQDSALHREKKSLSSAGWTSANAIDVAKYFLSNKDKATRLGTLMKRLKQLNVNLAIGNQDSVKALRSAVRAEVSAYTCYAKALRAFGKQVKCLNGAKKTGSNT